jgi:hypothetical protein
MDTASANSSRTTPQPTSSSSIDKTTWGARHADSRSSSSSSIGRSRLEVRLKRHSWRHLPTQRQLLAAGRPDLVAGLQKYGHDRIRRMLELPEPERKQLRKVGCVERLLLAGCRLFLWCPLCLGCQSS